MPSHKKRKVASASDDDNERARRRKLLEDDSLKVDDEKTLEGLLFGRTFGTEMPQDGSAIGIDDGDTEMRVLEDNDLFTVDDAPVAGTSTVDDAARSSSVHGAEQPQPDVFANSRSGKAAAWHDPADADVSLDRLSSSTRLRKLRDHPTENIADLSGREYESRLRRQWMRIYGEEPAWVKNARAAPRDVNDDERPHDELDGILSTTGIALASAKRAGEKLAVTRFHDVLPVGASHGEIRSLVFHPKCHDGVPVLAVGAADRRVRLFSVSPLRHMAIQTVHTPELPLTDLNFHPHGRHLLLTSERRGTLGCWDLSSGVLVWKDVALPKSYASLDVGTKRKRGAGVGSIAHPTFTPNQPHKVLAFASGGNSVHLVDWDGSGTTGGAGGHLATIKAGSDGIAGIGWTGEYTLTVLSSSSTIFLYDVRNIRSHAHSTRCVAKWVDEGGGYRGSARVLSTRGGGADDGAWMSVGSASGLTNVYALPALSVSPPSSPSPVKTVHSLRTPISLLKFNHDARILALASKDAPAKSVGLRLFHTPTLTTFPNFPTSATPLGRVTALDFGRGSAEGDERHEFLAIGNSKGRVSVWGVGY
ncbi:WD40 repeat-like protein [Fistulina hepatica ATCC 64428]|uniref:WD40 repeat-like protein n=1 Tax=Fistulina hepatica ATCC 64428 TaxID=1128425 RepID=A0A0D7AGT5_9AGAR|nr:WD40 repeat-like protein [Fistulina hepatica ATCC 64428]